ncbi:RNA-binding protein EIF1AD [Gracilaria domingensis]|nr:RNA-binding protein EIF1AD [Gracilaria domingensis]
MTARGKRRQRVQLLSEQPTLLPGQHVAQIVQALGENTYQALLADGRTALYRLPNRLRQVAYIRRGSFVFVRDHAGAISRITGDIETIVLSTFLSSIVKESFWPERFRGNEETDEHEQPRDPKEEDKEEEEEWSLGEGNPNRNVWDDPSSSSSEESSSGEEDDDQEATGER